MTATADFDLSDRFRPQRLEPLTALRAFRKLIRDKEDTAQVFEIMRALSGRSIARGYNRMLGTMEGGRQAFLREYQMTGCGASASGATLRASSARPSAVKPRASRNSR